MNSLHWCISYSVCVCLLVLGSVMSGVSSGCCGNILTVTNDTKGPDNSHAISKARRPLQASPTSFNLHHVDNRPLAQQWTLSWTMSTTPPPLSPPYNNALPTSRHPRRDKQQARHSRQQAHQGQQARQTTIRLAGEQQGSTETTSSGGDVMELATDT